MKQKIVMLALVSIWIGIALLGAGCMPSVGMETGDEAASMVLHGKLGTSDLRMQFREEYGKLIGSYTVDGGEELPIEGYPGDGHIILGTQTDRAYWDGACFYAQFGAGYDMQGVWVDGDETLPFQVSAQGVGGVPSLPTGDVLAFAGEWYGVGADYYRGTTLRMQPVSDDALWFFMEATNGGHAGDLTGLAKYADGAAVYATYDEGAIDPADAEVQFVFTQNEDGHLALDVTNGKYGYGCSAGTHFDSEFSRESLRDVVPKPDVLTEEQFKEMETLLGDEFDRFVLYSQNWFETEKVDDFASKVYIVDTTGFPSSGMVVLNQSKGTMMVLFECEASSTDFFYFSNDPDYTEPPKSIQRYLENGDYTLRSYGDE